MGRPVYLLLRTMCTWGIYHLSINNFCWYSLRYLELSWSTMSCQLIIVLMRWLAVCPSVNHLVGGQAPTRLPATTSSNPHFTPSSSQLNLLPKIKTEITNFYSL